MVRSVLFAVFLSFGTHFVRAQFQLILSGGSSHFLGDLGGSVSAGSIDIKDLNLQSTRYAIGAGVRGHVTPWLAAKSSVYYGRLSADDRFTSYLPRRNRNLNFFSPVYGGNLMLEVHFGLGSESKKRFFTSAGFEIFRFNPMTKYQGKTVELQPLGTEGQNFLPGKSPYALQSWAIPLGIGYKFYYFNSGFMSVELCARKTNTDYIDDASTTYVDKSALLASDGQMAVDLSDRSLGLIQGFSEPGSIRANSGYNDNFFFFSIAYNRTITSKGNRTARRKSGGLHPAKGKTSCYSF